MSSLLKEVLESSETGTILSFIDSHGHQHHGHHADVDEPNHGGSLETIGRTLTSRGSLETGVTIEDLHFDKSETEALGS